MKAGGISHRSAPERRCWGSTSAKPDRREILAVNLAGCRETGKQKAILAPLPRLSRVIHINLFAGGLSREFQPPRILSAEGLGMSAKSPEDRQRSERENPPRGLNTGRRWRFRHKLANESQNPKRQ